MPGCFKRYTDPSSLRKHIKNHSKEEQDQYKVYRERNLALEQGAVPVSQTPGHVPAPALGSVPTPAPCAAGSASAWPQESADQLVEHIAPGGVAGPGAVAARVEHTLQIDLEIYRQNAFHQYRKGKLRDVQRSVSYEPKIEIKLMTFIKYGIYRLHLIEK